MNRVSKCALGGIMSAFLATALTGCGDGGDLHIANGGPRDVTVLTGDDTVVVNAQGGVTILDNGCTPGDVTVEFSPGSQEVLSGPVCPDQSIEIGDGWATLKPTPEEGEH